MNLAYNGLPEEENSLSRTKDVYLDWMRKFLNNPPQNEIDHVNLRVEGWRILSGNKIPFEEERYRELHQEFIKRARHPTSHLNHVHVCRVSEEIVREVPFQVTVPTLVIHGSYDPLFPPDHGKELAARIKNSKYIAVDGMGHVPCAHFYDVIIDNIKHPFLFHEI